MYTDVQRTAREQDMAKKTEKMRKRQCFQVLIEICKPAHAYHTRPWAARRARPVSLEKSEWPGKDEYRWREEDPRIEDPEPNATRSGATPFLDLGSYLFIARCAVLYTSRASHDLRMSRIGKRTRT